MLFGEGWDERRNIANAEREGRIEAKKACCFDTLGGDRRLDLLQLGKEPCQRLEILLTGLGQTELAGAPLEQPHAEALLQGIQVFRRHAGGQAELPGGRGEAPRMRGARENLHSGDAIKHGNSKLAVRTESLSSQIITSQGKL
jgi:hypothetical protein